MTDLVARVCRIAANNLRAGQAFCPLLVLDGPNGSAVVRYDLTDLEPTHDKARLMALALQAETCIVAVEAALRFSGGVALRVVMLLTEGRDGCSVAMFAPRRTQGQVEFTEVTTHLAGQVPADVLNRLVQDVLPRSVNACDVDRAWLRLEKMGVTINHNTRYLH